MTRRHRDQTFRKADLTRAMKATQAAGVNARIEIDTIRRTITIIPGEPPQDGSKPNENMTNPWDKVLLNAADEKRPA